MADEYIKRSEVVLWLTKQRYAQPDRPKVQAELVDDVLCNAAQHFLKIPSADVVEVRHGKWIKDEDGCVVCSICGNPDEINGISGEFMYNNFCANCGADMRGGT